MGIKSVPRLSHVTPTAGCRDRREKVYNYVVALGFDPLWFGMMVCINLQMAFMTPPLAMSIFVCKGIAAPELGVTMADIIRGVIPFVVLVMVGLGLFITFPQIILWLPSQMITGW